MCAIFIIGRSNIICKIADAISATINEIMQKTILSANEFGFENLAIKRPIAAKTGTWIKYKA